MVVLWMVIGAVLGGLAAQNVFGALAGAALGLLWARQLKFARELAATRAQLDELLNKAGSSPHPGSSSELPWMTAEAARKAATPNVPAATDVSPPPVPSPAVNVSSVVAPHEEAEAEPLPTTQRSSRPPSTAPHPPSGVDLLFQRVWRWFTEGNVPVKIGMLVLFAGVAALLKYASDQNMLRVPIGLRVSAVALAAMAALVFGWRQRTQRRAFALSLQGGAIGVLLITVFAAFRLYDLLPATAAFALLVVLVAGVGMLAVLQDSLALAVLGLLAGFAAPILIATGSGNHVALFSYYAVLNLAILAIAWKRSWRVLNLLGFIATFAVGSAWGVLSYKPELFASTEPFLVLNFLFYVAIPWLHVLRAPADRKLVIDGSLMFGNPLISLLLQGALLRWDGQGLAISVLIAASMYVAIAFVARRHPAMRLLRETWAVLAVAFATLAVPLALSAQVTGSIFALEGAGLIWLGLRQQRPLARWSGLALQGLAAAAIVIGRLWHGDHAAWPLLNRDFIGALLLMIAALTSCRLYARLGGDGRLPRTIALLLYLWAMLWWLVACGVDIQRFVPLVHQPAAWFAWLALTAWAIAEAARRQSAHELGIALAFSPPLLFAAMLPLLGWMAWDGLQILRGWNLGACVLAGVLGWRSLACLREQVSAAALAEVVWLWRWLLAAMLAIAVALDGLRWMSSSWYVLLCLMPALLLYALTLWRPRLIASPLSALLSQWRPPMLYSLVLLLLLFGCWGLVQDGAAAPLAYVPLINPLELMLLLIALCVASWLSDATAPGELRRWRPFLFGGFVLAFVTSATLRAVHQLAGVPWSAALGESSLAQMSLTVAWSTLGLLAWVWGSRRGLRPVWLAGAIMLGVVLAKLILIDRRQLGNLFGIASFIAYGLLCAVIGYLAPAPPRRPSSSTEEASHEP